MGLIKGGLITFISILLFITLLSSNVLFTMSNSLEADTFKSEVVSVFKESSLYPELEEGVLDNIPDMQQHCINSSSYDYYDEEREEVFEVPCAVVNEGSEAVLDYVIEEYVESIYMEEESSEESESFSVEGIRKGLNKWFWITLFVSLGLILIQFFILDDKRRLPFLVGGLIVIASLPLLVIDWLVGFIGVFEFSEFLPLLFSKSGVTFITAFATGIIVMGIGIVLKFVHFEKSVSKTVKK